MRRDQIARARISICSQRTRLGVLALVAVALPLAFAAPSTSAPAKKAPLTISGKLNRAGYTVLAVGYKGKMTSTHSRSFKLRLAEKQVTLQLVGPRGKYAGPIVVGYKNGKAIVGVRAGAKLGLIKVLPSKGYARVAKTVRSKWLDAKRTALVKKQVPIGNGRNFGFVRSSRHNGPSGNGGDTDLDGVPNVLDVAASGALVFNSLRAGGTNAGPAFGSLFTPLADLLSAGPDIPPPPGAGPGGPAPTTSRWMSQIFLDIPHTLNADATGVTREQIDQALVANLNMKLLNPPTGDVVKLDCHGLSYCSTGGTGRAVLNGAFSSPGSGGPESISEPFPSCCTTGGDGFGILRGGASEVVLNGEFSLDPHAVSTKIGTGDMLTLLVTKDGVTTLQPAPLDFVFNTVPALKNFDGGTGLKTIDYSAGASAYGTRNNPMPVKVGAGGDIKVQLTWWRPQRNGIAGAGEPDFMDIGRLVYEFGIQPQGDLIPPRTNNDSGACSAASYTESDPNLVIVPQRQSSGTMSGELTDGSADQAANSANTLSVTLDLTKCVIDKGGPATIPVGTDIHMDISANAQSSADHANQDLYFRAS
jgi:hypothetical protein